MNTFGEIVEPVSRTSWEDWDEDNTDGNNTLLQWQRRLDIPDKIETLFILEGKFLTDSIRAQPKEHLNPVNCVNEVNLHLHQIQSSEKYICTIKDYNLLRSSEIIELLKYLIYKSNDVVTLQTKPLIEYQTVAITNQPWIIKKLTTTITSSNNLYDFNFGKLEQPNILSGVSAGALCLREHFNYPATALVCYIENIEEYQADEIYKLLERLHIIQKRPSKYNSILSSNLYI